VLSKQKIKRNRTAKKSLRTQ